MSLVRACLCPGQYLHWKAFLIEFANEQAAVNGAAGNTAWDVDMLLGQGRFAQQQREYPLHVFEQINNIATQAWNSLPNKGEVSGNLTKIIQGPMDILLTCKELKLLHLAYGDLVQTLEMKELYIAPEKVQQDQSEPVWVTERLTRRVPASEDGESHKQTNVTDADNHEGDVDQQDNSRTPMGDSVGVPETTANQTFCSFSLDFLVAI
ncbi:Retrovirus capsid, core containing protein [Cricetulus griseus]|uniref:Retrovirus capsid, core containing protein n=1 Tax=Cricetulus griseus TaxID=10029 RepID=A0A061II97_CRIGR|nr:Retrovirus capsid, core containing protein [Cricetulus griseus]